MLVQIVDENGRRNCRYWNPCYTLGLIFHVPFDMVDKMIDEIRAEMLIKTAAKTIVDKFYES